MIQNKNVLLPLLMVIAKKKKMGVKSVISAILLVFIALSATGQVCYKGSIDKYDIELVGDFYSDGVVNAFYVYTKFDEPIRLYGTLKNKCLILSEKDNVGKSTATLTFENFDIKKDTVKGLWREINSGRELKITLNKSFSINGNNGPVEMLQSASLKNKYFRLLVRTDPGDSYPEVKAVKIIEKKTDRLFQQIEIDCQPWGIDGIDVDDYNFDGFPDFSVFERSYAGPNTSRLYFLYNPNTGKFFKSTFEGTSLMFDQKAKRIYEHNQCCAGQSHVNSEYKVVNNKMVLISRTCLEYDASLGKLKEVKCE